MNCAFRFRTRSHDSLDRVEARDTPALLTRMCMASSCTDEGVSRAVAGAGVKLRPSARTSAPAAPPCLHVQADADDVRAGFGQASVMALPMPRRQPVTSAVLPSRRNRSARDINFSSTVQARAGMVPLRFGRRQREARTGQGKESRMLCKSLVTAAITLRWVLLVAHGKIATACTMATVADLLTTSAFAVSSPRPARHHRSSKCRRRRHSGRR